MFAETLQQIKDPLVIVLDSLDQLDASYNARSVNWIPEDLSPHVRFVVSTLEDKKYEAFPILKVWTNGLQREKLSNYLVGSDGHQRETALKQIK